MSAQLRPVASAPQPQDPNTLERGLASLQAREYIKTLCAIEDRNDALSIMQTLQNLLDQNDPPSPARGKALYVLQKLSVKVGTLVGIARITELANGESVGKGGFGVVTKFAQKDGSLVAVKSARSKDGLKCLIEEIVLIRQFSIHTNRNVIDLVGFCETTRRELCMVLPYMKNGNVREFARQNPSFDCLTASLEIRHGLDFLHSHDPPVYHRDLKCANVLVRDTRSVCLTDFGISRSVPVDMDVTKTQTIAGSIRWMAPERLNTSHLRNRSDSAESPSDSSLITPLLDKSDIWSFGMTVLELLTDKNPYSDFVDQDAYSAIFQGKPPTCASSDAIAVERGFTTRLWSDLLAKGCFKMPPSRRCTLDDLQRTLERLMDRRNQARRVAERRREAEGWVTEKVHLGTDDTGWFIGPNGQEVKRREETFGVKISLDKATKWVTAGGKDADMVLAAIEDIKDAVEYRLRLFHSAELNVRHLAFRRFQRRARVIPHLSSTYSSAYDNSEDRPMKVSFKGERSVVEMGMQLLTDVSDEYHNQRRMTIESSSLIRLYRRKLAELVEHCDGPNNVEDVIEEEGEDIIVIRGDLEFLQRLKKACEEEQERFILRWGIWIPEAWHQRLRNDIRQIKMVTNTQIFFPNEVRPSNDARDVVSNPAELHGRPDSEIFHVRGTKPGFREVKRLIKAAADRISRLQHVLSVPVQDHALVLELVERRLRGLRVKLGHSRALANSHSTDIPLAENNRENSGDGFVLEVHIRRDALDTCDMTWVLEAENEESLEKGRVLVENAKDRAAHASHAGFLIVPNDYSPHFGYLIGSNYQTLGGIERRTGTKIRIDKGRPIIRVVGSLEGIRSSVDDMKSILNKGRSRALSMSRSRTS